MAGTEAFPNVKDEDLAAVIQSFINSVAEITGTKRFHCVIAFWSEIGLTSLSTAGPNTDMTRLIVQSILDDIEKEVGKREVAATVPT